MPKAHFARRSALASARRRTALVSLALCSSPPSSRGLLLQQQRLAISTRCKTSPPTAFPARQCRLSADTRAYAASSMDTGSSSSLIDRTDTIEDTSVYDPSKTGDRTNEGAGYGSVPAAERRRTRREKLARKRRAVTKLEDEARDDQDKLFLLYATVPPFLAFLTWNDISWAVATFIDRFGAVGRAVDGNQFSTDLLRPTIVGVVVPVISIALATLVSTTVQVLRLRQVELRALVNKEVCELRLLRRAVFGMFGTRQHAGRRARALDLLRSYAVQLGRESSEGAVEALEELQLSGGIAKNELDRLSGMLHGVDGAAASRQGSVGAADDLVMSLNGHRSDRVALLLSVFPTIHWVILGALSLSICVAFLMVSNQQVLQYLNSVQLRTLFAILVGVVAGTATLCLDLADPFSGSFSIAEASSQLVDLRVCLEEDVAEAVAEAGETMVVQDLFGGLSDSSSKSGAGGYSIPVLGPSEQFGDRSGGGWVPSYSSSAASTTPISSTSSDSDKVVVDADAAIASNSADGSQRNGGGGGNGNSIGGQQWGSSSPRSRYGLASTLYFHLLTGPFGSNVRLLGDAVAWLAAIAARRARALSRRVAAFASSAMGRGWWPRRRRRQCKNK